MFTEICLGVLTATTVIFVVFLLKFFSRIQTDLHHLSRDTKELVDSMKTFIQGDLHAISDKTQHFIGSLDELSSDIGNKSRSLNFLFQPLGFLNSKLEAFSSKDETTSQRSTIPQLMRWIVSSVLLIKKSKEFIKDHEKRT